MDAHGESARKANENILPAPVDALNRASTGEGFSTSAGSCGVVIRRRSMWAATIVAPIACFRSLRHTASTSGNSGIEAFSFQLLAFSF
jgi:hypothetical protein